MEIEIRTLGPRVYIGVRRTVKHDGIGPACGEILPRAWGWLKAKGLAPAGPPIVVYHALDRATGEFDIQPALFLAQRVEGEGELTIGETPGGEYLVATHVGPYGTLGDTWSAVLAKAGALGRTVSNGGWESYLDDPSSVEPAKLRTEIFVPLDPK